MGLGREGTLTDGGIPHTGLQNELSFSSKRFHSLSTIPNPLFGFPLLLYWRVGVRIPGGTGWWFGTFGPLCSPLPCPSTWCSVEGTSTKVSVPPPSVHGRVLYPVLRGIDVDNYWWFVSQYPCGLLHPFYITFSIVNSTVTLMNMINILPFLRFTLVVKTGPWPKRRPSPPVRVPSDTPVSSGLQPDEGLLSRVVGGNETCDPETYIPPAYFIPCEAS